MNPTQNPAPVCAHHPYVCLSFLSWREGASEAIQLRQSESDFVARFHPDNRTNARNAYRVEYAAQVKRNAPEYVDADGNPHYATR